MLMLKLAFIIIKTSLHEDPPSASEIRTVTGDEGGDVEGTCIYVKRGWTQLDINTR